MIWAFIRWALVMLWNLFLFATTWFMFPLAYLTRNIPLFRNYILWVYWDDEIENMPSDFVMWMIGKTWNFKTSYKWHVRQSGWNGQTIIKIKSGLRKYVSHSGYITQNENADISVFTFAGLKYIDENYNPIDNNSSGYLDFKRSVFGKMFVKYKIDNTLYWSYSYCKPILGRIYLMIHAGTNIRRYLFTVRLKKVRIL